MTFYKVMWCISIFSVCSTQKSPICEPSQLVHCNERLKRIRMIQWFSHSNSRGEENIISEYQLKFEWFCAVLNVVVQVYLCLCQVLMPLLKSDLYEVLKNTLQSDLSSNPVQWLEDSAAVTVVMASGGYPASYKKGLDITGALPLMSTLRYVTLIIIIECPRL